MPISRLYFDEAGATAVEYGFIGALVSLAIVSGLGALGASLADLYDLVASKLKP